MDALTYSYTRQHLADVMRRVNEDRSPVRRASALVALVRATIFAISSCFVMKFSFFGK